MSLRTEFSGPIKRPSSMRPESSVTFFAARARFAELGALLSYGVEAAKVWRQSAQYVDRILKGSRPGDLPIQQPTAFDLVVNLKTAKALGIAIPPSVLVGLTRSSDDVCAIQTSAEIPRTTAKVACRKNRHHDQ